MAAQTPVIIDLTLDDDEDGHSENSSTPLVPPPGWEHVRLQPRQLSTLGVFRPLAVPRPDLRGNEANDDDADDDDADDDDADDDDADDDGAHERPNKRRRTTVFAKEPRSRANQQDSNTRVVLYLKGTLWPHIENVIEELFPRLAQHQKNKLHFAVANHVVENDGFATELETSGGKPSAASEAWAQRRIRDLVVRLKDQPVSVVRATRPHTRRRHLAVQCRGADIRSQERLSSPPVQKRRDVEPSIEGTPEAQHLPTNGQAGSSSRTAHGTPRVPDAPTNGIPISTSSPQPQAWNPRPTAEPTADGLRSQRHKKKKTPKTGPVPGQSGHVMQQPEDVDPTTVSPWSGARSRPYLTADRREVLGREQETFFLPDSDVPCLPSVLHVDFSDVEVNYLQFVARQCHESNHRVTRDTLDDLRHLIKKSRKLNSPNKIVQVHQRRYEGIAKPPPFTITARSAEDINNFLRDLLKRKVHLGPAQKLTLDRDGSSSSTVQPDRIASLLYAREIVGNRAFGSVRRYENFPTALKTVQEDTLEPWIEWTNCAGDIATFSWVSDTQFLCGTTTHSDSHNQQYNKEGNLLLGSSRGKLQAYPDHRIVRPLVSHGDNALDSMVQSQDPWLFCSVVDSDYDPQHNLGFTSSFDNTVKIWRIKDESMEAIGTWQHEGRVNFVVVSKHESGMVATATDVSTDAVRVYHIGQSLEAYDAYSCTRIHDQEYVPSEKWGYCPAAIRWGLAPDAQELLLIGYSPRSFTGDDHDIPEDKKDTGELCLWNIITKTQVKINSVAMQNVFEVVWHPSRATFAVATSKAKAKTKAQTLEKTDHNVKTQVRIFEPNTDGQYTAVKVLDCPGLDINELVIRWVFKRAGLEQSLTFV
jgi:WD40 repeat protein